MPTIALKLNITFKKILRCPPNFFKQKRAGLPKRLPADGMGY